MRLLQAGPTCWPLMLTMTQPTRVAPNSSGARMWGKLQSTHLLALDLDHDSAHKSSTERFRSKNVEEAAEYPPAGP